MGDHFTKYILSSHCRGEAMRRGKGVLFKGAWPLELKTMLKFLCRLVLGPSFVRTFGYLSLSSLPFKFLVSTFMNYLHVYYYLAILIAIGALQVKSVTAAMSFVYVLFSCSSLFLTRFSPEVPELFNINYELKLHSTSIPILTRVPTT